MEKGTMKSESQTALVIGATGGTGKAITDELLRRNLPTAVLVRSPHKMGSVADRVTVFEGNVFDSAAVQRAAQDVDIVFQCAAVPYNEMERKQLPLGESVMGAMARLRKKIVFVDGIYPYGDVNGVVEETTPKRPNTRKGKIKLALAELIFSNAYKDAKPIIARLPDYYGPTAGVSSYLGSTLIGIASEKPTVFIGNLHTPREYVYLPDAAHMVVETALRDESYRQEWNIPGQVISGKDIVHIARRAVAKRRMVIPLGSFRLRMLGLFNPVMAEIVEMLYLTKRPVILSGTKYRNEIGDIIRTPFAKGIEETIAAIRDRNQ